MQTDDKFVELDSETIRSAGVPANAAMLEQWFLRRLPAPLPGARAQRRFAPSPPRAGWSPSNAPSTARRAAVVVLLYDRADAVHVALTVRHHLLPHHAGQVSLPGGAIDPGESIPDAALREVNEEIGLPPSAIRLLGQLSSLWVPVSNFVLHPVVGVTTANPIFRPREGEVAAIIDASLATLADPATHGHHRAVRDGIAVEYRAFHVAGHVVWGATAMVLAELLSLFEDGDAREPA